MIRSTKILSVAALAVICAAVVGCGGGDLSTEDAHDTATRCRYLSETNLAPGQTGRDDPQANVGACLDDRQKRSIAFPNHFPNVATACDGYGHRIFTTTNRTVYIVADPSCPGWSADTPKMGVVTDAGER